MKISLRRIVLPLAEFSVELDVELNNRATGVFGPSGGGKTSLLDLIAGLRRASSARITLDEQVLTDTDNGILVPPHRRGIGYVPQDLALFPHLSVEENLRYGFTAGTRRDDALAPSRVAKVLEIEPLMRRGTRELSGGERQRIAFARALLSSPRLLLLDEPLAGLDSRLKGEMMALLLRIREEFALPMIYISHDAAEQRRLCDEVLVMERGRIARRLPASDFV